MDDVEYNVVCFACGRVWSPKTKSALWWKAKKRADQGFMDAIHVSGVECGCKQSIEEPDAPYRVFGYNEFGEGFDLPYLSLVEAARAFLRMSRHTLNVVFFKDSTKKESDKSRLQGRLHQMAWNWS